MFYKRFRYLMMIRRRLTQLDQHTVRCDDDGHRNLLSGRGRNADATNTVAKPQCRQRRTCLLDLALERKQEESVPRSRRCGRRVVGTLENDQFNDAAVGCLRIAKEYRSQPVGFGVKSCGQSPVKVRSNSSVNPGPSRQNFIERSTSAVRIAA